MELVFLGKLIVALMFNEFPEFYSRRILVFIIVFTSSHPVDPNPEPGKCVIHLDALIYLRFSSGKPPENLTAGFNKYCV